MKRNVGSWIGAILLLLSGCGVNGVNRDRLEVACGPIPDAELETVIIVLEAARDDGISKFDAIRGIGQICDDVVRAKIEEDWIVFEDAETDATCGLVNTASEDFIVLFDDGVMVQVSGPDMVFENLVVAEDFTVLLEGESIGFIEYAEDGDGLPTVFWFTNEGTIVEVENGVPFDSGLRPVDITGTGCDACEQIDSSSLCVDNPANGGGGMTTDEFSECVICLTALVDEIWR